MVPRPQNLDSPRPAFLTRALFSLLAARPGSNIEVGPSLMPKKKYSDISGLEASYTDPKTKLRYASVEEYKRVKDMPYELVQATLSLRGANVVFR